MKKVKTAAHELKETIQRCVFGISYIPLDDEVDPLACPFIPKTLPLEKVPQDLNISSSQYAQELIRAHGHAISVCICIPGQAFDAYGTRHGRGGGWYDRFLSEVPPHWLRIGVTPINRFHTEKLFHAPHDQPVDFVITFDLLKKTWDILKTHARISLP
ncbi:hypothetical protein HYW94_01365 [Candidatus Uhrbacteria bacterium]|nr:hypothetical protein [Candidatus Uhrbacteria bacterium]